MSSRRNSSSSARSSAKTGTGTLSLKDIENLFVEKLSEKYKLTTRDLKKAFQKFDKDGDGHLSVNELTGF